MKRYHIDVPRGYAKSQLRHARRKWQLENKVQIHHVIPRTMKRSNMLRRFDYDIEAPYNLILLPTSFGASEINTTRLIHENGHPSYNEYISNSLINIDNRMDFCAPVDVSAQRIEGGKSKYHGTK